MTPKEKAEELVAKFFQFKPRLKFDIDNENEYYQANKCALIAVNELIEETDYYFWQEVKKEIQRL